MPHDLLPTTLQQMLAVVVGIVVAIAW